MLADRIGIERTLMTMSFVPLAAAALALPLPGGMPGHVVRRASAISAAESAGTDVAQ
jgi:hypothetical protein